MVGHHDRSRIGLGQRLNGCLHLTRIDFGTRDGRKEIIELGESRLVRHGFEVECRHTGTREFAFDHRATLRNRRLELLRLEPLAHLRARVPTMNVTEVRIEPVAAWAHRRAVLDRDDFYLLAAA
jgi:hypothetical protein